MGVIIIILIVFIAIIMVIYNRLVAARNLVENGWSDIDVQLKRRVDLIPRLVDTVKGYAEHERSLFEDLTAKRGEAMKAQTPTSRAQAESAMKAPLSRLLAVAENYPDLKANENFLELQNELSETENKIEYARRFYNGAVRQMNTLVQSFPVNLLAGMFGFSQKDFFEMDETVALPDMQFDT